MKSVGRLLILIRKYAVKTYGYNYEGNGFFETRLIKLVRKHAAHTPHPGAESSGMYQE